MITNIFFVRHAHSTYTPDELERPLSDRGLEDAKKVTDLLTREDIDHVISSPYKRAIQTVEGIAKYIGTEIKVVDDLRERTLSENPVTDFNEAISKVWSDFDFMLVGGESSHAAQKRGVDATLEILDKYKGQNIVIGSHGNIMVLIMNHFDQSYDVQFWEQLEMPDIYKLSFYGKQLIEVRRIDDSEASLLNTGYTIYKSTGIELEYPLVNLEKETVTGTVSFENKVYLTVTVDFQSDTVEVVGDVTDFSHLLPTEHTESEYIEIIKTNAKFLIENKITNPKELYENSLSRGE